MTYEQLPTLEREPLLPPRSIDLFDGSLEFGVSWSFNDAVIEAQRAMGSDYYLTPTSFGDIMPSNWGGMKAGQALDAFDKAYRQFVLEKQGYTEDEIAQVAAQEDNDIAAQEELAAQYTSDSEQDMQRRFDRELGDIALSFADETEHPLGDHELNAFAADEADLGRTQAEVKTDPTEPYNPHAELLAEKLGSDEERDVNLAAFHNFLASHPELTDPEKAALAKEFSSDLEAYLRQKYS